MTPKKDTTSAAKPKPSSKYDYSGLELVGRRREDNGVLEFGTEVSGVFVSLGAAKLPDFDQSVAEAKDAKAKADTQTSTT